MSIRLVLQVLDHALFSLVLIRQLAKLFLVLQYLLLEFQDGLVLAIDLVQILIDMVLLLSDLLLEIGYDLLCVLVSVFKTTVTFPELLKFLLLFHLLLLKLVVRALKVFDSGIGLLDSMLVQLPILEVGVACSENGQYYKKAKDDGADLPLEETARLDLDLPALRLIDLLVYFALPKFNCSLYFVWFHHLHLAECHFQLLNVQYFGCF